MNKIYKNIIKNSQMTLTISSSRNESINMKKSLQFILSNQLSDCTSRNLICLNKTEFGKKLTLLLIHQMLESDAQRLQALNWCVLLHLQVTNCHLWYFGGKCQRIDNRHTCIMICSSSFKDASQNGIITFKVRQNEWEHQGENDGSFIKSDYLYQDLTNKGFLTFERLLSMKIKKMLEEELKNTSEILSLGQFFVLLVGTLLSQ